MSKPYIEVYQNELEDAVIVYLGEVEIGVQVTPEYIAIKPDHIDEVIKALKQYKKEML